MFEHQLNTRSAYTRKYNLHVHICTQDRVSTAAARTDQDTTGGGQREACIGLNGRG